MEQMIDPKIQRKLPAVQYPRQVRQAQHAMARRPRHSEARSGNLSLLLLLAQELLHNRFKPGIVFRRIPLLCRMVQCTILKIEQSQRNFVPPTSPARINGKPPAHPRRPRSASAAAAAASRSSSSITRPDAGRMSCPRNTSGSYPPRNTRRKVSCLRRALHQKRNILPFVDHRPRQRQAQHALAVPGWPQRCGPEHHCNASCCRNSDTIYHHPPFPAKPAGTAASAPPPAGRPRGSPIHTSPPPPRGPARPGRSGRRSDGADLNAVRSAMAFASSPVR